MGDFDFDYVRRYTYRPEHSGDTFAPAFWVYVLVTVGSCGLLFPVCLIVGLVHYALWKLSRN